MAGKTFDVENIKFVCTPVVSYARVTSLAGGRPAVDFEIVVPTNVGRFSFAGILHNNGKQVEYATVAYSPQENLPAHLDGSQYERQECLFADDFLICHRENDVVRLAWLCAYEVYLYIEEEITALRFRLWEYMERCAEQGRPMLGKCLECVNTPYYRFNDMATREEMRAVTHAESTYAG